jgi:uncharacterized membrane protein
MKEVIARMPGWLRRLVQLAIGYVLTYFGVVVPGFNPDPEAMTAIAILAGYVVGLVTPLDQGTGAFKVDPLRVNRA